MWQFFSARSRWAWMHRGAGEALGAAGEQMGPRRGPISIGLRIGEDFGFNPGVSMKGTLSYP
jgi:hypothetical protein